MSDKQYVIEATPIDRAQPGSWRAVKRLMALSGRLQGTAFDPAAFVEFMDFIESRTNVPEGADYTLAEALDAAEFDDMMALAQVITGENSAEGEASGGN